MNDVSWDCDCPCGCRTHVAWADAPLPEGFSVRCLDCVEGTHMRGQEQYAKESK